MKYIVLSSVVCMLLFASCNNQGKQNAGTEKAATPSAVTTTTTNNTVVKNIVDGYLQMKNALANDNGSDAAAAGNTMVTAFGKLDTSALTTAQKKTYEDVEDDAREHAEHIGKNAGNIPHQREHFEMLSKDVYQLVKTFGSGGLLYLDYCPMYNDGKGATWLSEVKEIKNPYLGKKMPTCGSVKEELK